MTQQERSTQLVNRIVNALAFAIFAALWLGFAYALVFDRGLLDNIWRTARSWPMAVQVVVGIVLLPVAAGLWIWESSWMLWLRVLLVIGLGLVTLYVFFPRRKKA